eukprot:TRINITY_DN5487_c1_g3_i2.p1 TRINITY_DN5487_c1_g3~~TRINITY_DN5487_c1_g3_i2.p1  ORF type:complete len:108 (-),score=18.67 TRINITY_DN5487_c1_g3_i2:36-359(-)
MLSSNPYISTIGVGEFKTRFVLPLFNAFPDLKWVAHEVIYDNQASLVTRWTFSATFSGSDYLGYQSNNHRVSWEGMTLMHLNSTGKVYESKSFFDMRKLTAQLAVDN